MILNITFIWQYYFANRPRSDADDAGGAHCRTVDGYIHLPRSLVAVHLAHQATEHLHIAGLRETGGGVSSHVQTRGELQQGDVIRSGCFIVVFMDKYPRNLEVLILCPSIH